MEIYKSKPKKLLEVDDSISVVLTKSGILYVRNDMFKILEITDADTIYILDKEAKLSYLNPNGEKTPRKLGLEKEYRLIVNGVGFEYYFYNNLDDNKRYLFDQNLNVLATNPEGTEKVTEDKQNIRASLLFRNNAVIYEKISSVKQIDDDLYDIKMKRYIKK